MSSVGKCHNKYSIYVFHYGYLHTTIQNAYISNYLYYYKLFGKRENFVNVLF